MDNVKERVLAIVSDYVGTAPEDIDENESFKLGVGLDSFSVISMISAIEDEFGKEIPEAELKKFKTISDIIEFMK